MPNGNGAPPRTSGPPRPGSKPPMKQSTRNWLIIGAVAVAGGIIWYVMRNRSQSSQAAQSGIDPATGVPYAQEYGGYGVAGSGPGAPSLYGYYDPTTGTYVSGTGSTGVVTAPSTNASWAQQAEAYLQQLGYDPMAVAAALGKYLTGQSLTSDQAGIVAAAQGFYGNPPQGAPPIVTTTPTGQGGGILQAPWASLKTITERQKETLSQLAAREHWGAGTLAAVEQLNNLQAGSQLRKGQQIIRPIR